MSGPLFRFATGRPKVVLALALLVTALSLLRVGTFQVDTDPENMLRADEPVRVFHNEVKRDFALSDMIVLGVVNEEDPAGVFNPATLEKVYRITAGIRDLDGVVAQDLMSLSTVDDILQAGPGAVRFQFLMESPPTTRDQALQIRDRAAANPLLHGTLVSEDGKALAIYIPIEEKNLAHRISQQVGELITAEPPGGESFHITGLPVAEDTFGVEMFRQMAVSAPIAGLVVFLLMLFFFRRLALVAAPMVVAVLTVVITMGTLVATGNTVHIMSSMIPIFLMPIAVVDSVHVLSVFFDRYQLYRDRSRTLRAVLEELFTPMLYTSLTTLAGFASLALTPIPPVQVFGLFVAFGVAVAWGLTVTLVPAYIVLFIPERQLLDFGAATGHGDEEGHGPLARLLAWGARVTRERAKVWLAVTGVILVVSGYGISRIQINDNPVKWFVPDHPIRVADEVLNRHFGGTYEAYLVLEPAPAPEAYGQALDELGRFLTQTAQEAPRPEIVHLASGLRDTLEELRSAAGTSVGETGLDGILAALDRTLEDLAADLTTSDPQVWEAVDRLDEGLEDRRTARHRFKDPAMLRYVAGLQEHLARSAVVGKSNALPDLVRKVHQELLSGEPAEFRIPDTPAAVAQVLLSFQGSHDPDDLWHLVTPDFRRLNVWVQLKSGDNKEMERVVQVVDDYLAASPPPVPLTHAWAGLTYLNVIWQDKMVLGMLSSLLGSFGIVLVIMTFLFRSPLWGILSMVPLSVTIAFIYGLIGLVGKDYDMPVAVLSSLTLGMSIDFAIHYIERARRQQRDTGSWAETSRLMGGAPARAIARNAVVIAVGFLPLLLASLVPYRTVGFFLAAIMGVSGVATLVILPSLISTFRRALFPSEREQMDQPPAAAA